MNASSKDVARKAAFARRKAAFDAQSPGAAGKLSEFLAGYRGVPIAGYIPIRSEIDPTPAMAEASAHGPVAVPVIKAAATPLDFAQWDPDCAMEEGAFGANVPVNKVFIRPEIVIVPLVAFSRSGGRMGYGGGFYDRTLELLRGNGAVLAVGFAFAAQEDAELPLEPTDQPLDLIITEHEVLSCRQA